MLWGNIIKAIPFVLQVILVVVAVALFAFFDPFGIFIQSKTKLKDTPVDVRSIREIGELITAEYYGEVIGSYAHEIEEQQNTGEEEYKEVMLDMLDNYVMGISELHEKYASGKIKKRKIYDQFIQEFSDINGDPFFETFLLYKSDINGFKAKHLDDQLGSMKKKNLVREDVKNGIEDQKMLNQPEAYLKDLFDINRGILNKEKKKQLKRKNLVMLGRGWVKAGFDFGTFTERNFNYDKASNNIYFIGFNPKILSSTINPWFIPEEGVEGFEFLVVERKAKRDYKVVQLVKQRCLDELNRKAQEREILQIAIKNGKESMKEFFSLIMDEEINQVVFYDNELDYSYDEIMKNDTITGEELLLIDHLLQKETLQGVDTADVYKEKQVFIEKLLSIDQTNFLLMDSIVVGQWSPEFIITYAVARNGVYDQQLDSILIRNLSNKYCEFAASMDSLKYNCKGSEFQNPFYRKYINVFIARDLETQNFIYNKYSEGLQLDSLFSQQGKYKGISLSRGPIDLTFDSLLVSQATKACVCD